jgi:hypothetical protein
MRAPPAADTWSVRSALFGLGAAIRLVPGRLGLACLARVPDRRRRGDRRGRPGRHGRREQADRCDARRAGARPDDGDSDRDRRSTQRSDRDAGRSACHAERSTSGSDHLTTARRPDGLAGRAPERLHGRPRIHPGRWVRPGPGGGQSPLGLDVRAARRRRPRLQPVLQPAPWLLRGLQRRLRHGRSGRTGQSGGLCQGVPGRLCAANHTLAVLCKGNEAPDFVTGAGTL